MVVAVKCKCVAQAEIWGFNVINPHGYWCVSLCYATISYSCNSTPQRRLRGRCRLRHQLWRLRREEWSFASPSWTPPDTAMPSIARTGVFFWCGGVRRVITTWDMFPVQHAVSSFPPVLNNSLSQVSSQTPYFLPLLPLHSLPLDFLKLCVCSNVCVFACMASLCHWCQYNLLAKIYFLWIVLA